MVLEVDSGEVKSPRLADLFTILIRPRATMRRILDGGRHRWEVQVVVLAFVGASSTDIDIRQITEVLPGLRLWPALAIVALSIIVGSLAWIIALFIMSWIATPIGRMLGGTASFADVRAALGWAMTPVVWSAIYRVPIALAATHFYIPPHPDVRRLLLNFVARGGCSIVLLFLGLQLLFALWSIVVGSFTVAEAQRFSTEKGFVNVAVAVALPILIIASAVFTFRS